MYRNIGSNKNQKRFFTANPSVISSTSSPPIGTLLKRSRITNSETQDPEDSEPKRQRSSHDSQYYTIQLNWKVTPNTQLILSPRNVVAGKLADTCYDLFNHLKLEIRRKCIDCISNLVRVVSTCKDAEFSRSELGTIFVAIVTLERAFIESTQVPCLSEKRRLDEENSYFEKCLTEVMVARELNTDNDESFVRIFTYFPTIISENDVAAQALLFHLRNKASHFRETDNTLTTNCKICEWAKPNFKSYASINQNVSNYSKNSDCMEVLNNLMDNHQEELLDKILTSLKATKRFFSTNSTALRTLFERYHKLTKTALPNNYVAYVMSMTDDDHDDNM